MSRALPVLFLLLVGGAALVAATDKCVAGARQPDDEDPDVTDSPCKKCSADGSKCEECWLTYAPNSKGECVRCDSPGQCFKCKSGDEPGFCLECGDWWGEAETGFYATKKGTCKACPEKNCMQCEQLTGVCTQCTTGMGVIDGRCQPCKDSDNCLFCNGDLAVCEECMSGYFLRDGKCVACPPNCQKCASEERCDECDSFGFALDEASALCVPCTDGCTYCPDGADTCESCDIGYTQMGNGTDGCAKCTDPHCTTCTPDKPDECEICADASLLWGVDLPTKTCVKCKIDNCAACQMDATVCDWCEDGFFNDAKNKVCSPCKGEGCTSCGTNATPGHDPTVEECFGCAEGYDLQGEPPKCVKL